MTMGPYQLNVAIENIAALRALKTPISQIFVQGYYNVGDGGGGSFSHAPTDTYSPDNGGTIIVDAVGNRYYRQISSGPINILWFGAKGDASTDNTIFIQNAVDSILNGGEIFIPIGQFNLSGTILINHQISIIGVGGTTGAASIFAGTMTNQDMFEVFCAAQVCFRNIQISTTVSKISGTAIHINSAEGTQNNFSIFENIFFQGQYNSIYFDRAAYWIINGCWFHGNSPNGTCVTVQNTQTADSGDQIISDSSFYDGSGSTHVAYRSGGGLKIVGNKFLGAKINIDANFSVDAQSGILIATANSFDGAEQHSVLISTSSASSMLTNINITGNDFNGGPSVAFITVAPYPGSTISRVNITSNLFIRHFGFGDVIKLDGGGTINVVANLINAASGIVGINVGSGVVDAVIGPNQLEGGAEIQNNSGAVLVINPGSGANKALILSGALAVGKMSPPKSPLDVHVGVDRNLRVINPISLSNGVVVSSENDLGTENRSLELRGTTMRLSGSVNIEIIPGLSVGGNISAEAITATGIGVGTAPVTGVALRGLKSSGDIKSTMETSTSGNPSWELLAQGAVLADFTTDRESLGVRLRNRSSGSLEFYTSDVKRFFVDQYGNVVTNTAAISTSASDGFLYVPTCSGAPTGTPRNYPGMVAHVIDTSNNRAYWYCGGSWRYVVLT